MNNESLKANGLVDITERLSTYENDVTTGELYDFGKMLVLEAVERAHWLDAKAGVLAGFSGAIVALLLSTFSNWKNALDILPTGFRFVVFAGVLSLLIGNAAAFFGLIVRTFQWLDEKEIWFPKDYLEFPDQLRRYYLVAMYRVIASHDAVNRRKTTCLTAAQSMLFVGGVLLSVLLLAILWTAVRPG